jgi:hypothetical protein
MFIKATSILRSALLGTAVAASAMLAPVAMAQGPGPGFPGASPYYSRPVDPGLAPRPDFPGARQATAPRTRQDCINAVREKFGISREEAAKQEHMHSVMRCMARGTVE